MIDNNSWIKLYRKFREWGWYQDSNTKSVWLEILLTANTEDKEWLGIQVKRGQLITSIKHLSKILGISNMSIRTSLKHLKSTKEITIQTTPNYTLITINKYNDYQQLTKQLTNDQQTTNKRLTTTKEYKNIRIKDKEIYKESFESLEKITPEVVNYIANHYHVKESFVEKQRQQLELYCQSNGKKYKDYKATLMMWVNRKLDEAPKTERLKDLEPKHVEDLRLHPEKLYVYQNLGYDVSRVGGLCK